MVKLLSHNNQHELEKIINDWISNQHIEVIDIKYSTILWNECIIYCVLIIY